MKKEEEEEKGGRQDGAVPCRAVPLLIDYCVRLKSGRSEKVDGG